MADSQRRGPPDISAALACHNMFGGGSSKSTQTSADYRVAASEGSLAVGAGGHYQESGSISTGTVGELGTTKAESGGKILSDSLDLSGTGNKSQRAGGDVFDVSGRILGQNAVDISGKYQAAGAQDLSGASNFGNVDFAGAHDVSITTADVDVLNKALDKYTELSAGFGSSLNQFVSQASEDQDKKVATLLTAVEQGKASEDTAAQNRKTFLYVVFAVIGLLAFLNWRKG
jgi:hypothetical protein